MMFNFSYIWFGCFLWLAICYIRLLKEYNRLVNLLFNMKVGNSEANEMVKEVINKTELIKKD